MRTTLRRLVAFALLLLGTVMMLATSHGPNRPLDPLRDSEGRILSPGIDLEAKTQTKPAPVLRDLSQLPLAFEANLGQANRSARFLSRGPGYGVTLTDTDAVLAFGSPHNSQSESDVVRMRLGGSRALLNPEGEDQLRVRTNYFIGNDPTKWLENVPSYSRVRYANVYDGIDLIYYGNQRQLEFDFAVAPFADAGSIRLNFGGLLKLILASDGDLILTSRRGKLRQRKPVVYQEIDGVRKETEGRYVLTGRNEVRFEIGEYDKTRPLVIDPVLVYSTYVGGTGNDFGNSIAQDSAGNIYVTGETNSVNFPTHNPLQVVGAGNSDVFVTKLDSTGSAQIYSTYIGGSGLDRGDCITVDSNGNAYIVGRVDSASVNFPTTVGSFQPTYRGGDFDGFVTKLNADGNALVYSSYLGGNDNDSAVGIAVDSAFNAFITGGTKSSDYPTTPNAYQTSIAGDTDAFVTKLNPAGSTSIYSTLVGGLSTDRGSSLAVDANGSAFLGGLTRSTDFPTVNGFQNANAGAFDAFVLKLNNDGTDLLFATYLGGSGDDRAFGLALDGANNCYIAGQTSSNNFPVANALYPTFGGSFDAFVAKIDSAGTKLYATYLGGTADDRATAIAVGANQPYITGFTSSSNFPTSNAIQNTNAGGTDAFISKLNAGGTALVYSTYLGGAANDNFNNQNITYSGGVAADSLGNAYLTGFTFSTNFPITGGPFQSSNAGSSDAFVLKIADTGSSGDFSVSASPANRLVVPGGVTTYDVSITPSGGFTGQVDFSLSGLPTSSSGSFNPVSVNVSGSSTVTSTLTVTTTLSTPLGEAQLTITGTAGVLHRNGATKLTVVSPASADLALNKTGSPNPAAVGANLSYRLVVTNNGPGGATGVITSDMLPGNVTFVSATPTQGTCSGTASINCNLGSLAANANAAVTIVVTPNQIGQLSNTASVVANESDPVAANNSQTAQTNVQSQASGPTMLDANLTVSTVFTGLNQPTSMVFLGANDLLVLEKTTGKVQRIVNVYRKWVRLSLLDRE